MLGEFQVHDSRNTGTNHPELHRVQGSPAPYVVQGVIDNGGYR